MTTREQEGMNQACLLRRNGSDTAVVAQRGPRKRLSSLGTTRTMAGRPSGDEE
jgi:hypothetical protein